MKRRLIDVLLVTVGFILSPLSWWNDPLVNLPLAYLFSLPFSLINEQYFLPALMLGYWLSNLLGFLMLHWGGEGLVYRRRSSISLKRSLIASVVYSLLMIVFVLLGWLVPPTEYQPYWE